jgi:hypothetical protein
MTCTGQALAAFSICSACSSKFAEILTRDLSVTSNIAGAINWQAPHAIQPGSMVGGKKFLGDFIS